MIFSKALSPDGRRQAIAVSTIAGLVLLPLSLTSWNVAAALTQDTANAQLLQMLNALEDRRDAPVTDPASKADQLARSFLAGETVGMAGAALQAEVAAIVESVEAKTVETELLDPEDEADRKDLRLRITFEAKNDALQRVLLAIEGNATALYLRTLSIEPANSSADGELAEPTLRTTAVIEGYWGEGG